MGWKKPPPYAPVVNYNGTIVADRTASLSQGSDARNLAPNLYRRWTNLGYTEPQLHTGLGKKQASGRRFPYMNQMFVWAFIPRIPGQTRGDVAGFHKTGPSSYNIEDWLMQGPGSQPEHPGGPGMVAGSAVYNPMGG